MPDFAYILLYNLDSYVSAFLKVLSFAPEVATS
jgi:hypothetical protein